ncbi:MAG: TatD family nuclease-associated radical SAM protein [Oscillospiraceae bacterium]|nr:TatD family nuclease-associated radical SAM protein [Oscillospiraceae bacterium]
MKDNTIFYKLGDNLYVNITNRCSCDCVFCIRKNGDSVGNAATLWLEREPTVEEIKRDFDTQELTGITEIVFCGYGEPMERADDVVELCGYFKTKTTIPLRLNTNGLVKLINEEFDVSRLSVFDFISVSLNADNPVDYQKLSRTVFGEVSFKSMLEFAKDVKKFANVAFTVVDFNGLDTEKCRIISDSVGIPLRIRHFEG